VILENFEIVIGSNNSGCNITLFRSSLYNFLLPGRPSLDIFSQAFTRGMKDSRDFIVISFK
jgi:hypothetical protein